MNHYGFSLVQVLFASSVLGALSLQGIKMMKEQEALALLTTQRFEIQYILDEMAEVLKDPASCTSTLGQADGAIEEIHHVFRDPHEQMDSRLFLYQVYHRSERLYGQGTLRIDKYELLLEEPRAGQARLAVRFDRALPQDPSRFLQREIPLTLVWNEQGRISSCSLASSAHDQTLWTSTAGASAAISPVSEGLAIGSLLTQSNFSLHGTLLAQAPGALEACTTTTQSSLIYDQSDDQWKYCSNGEWTSLSQGLWTWNSDEVVQLQNPTRLQGSVQAQLCTLTEVRTISGQSRCILQSPQKLSRMERDPGHWTFELVANPTDDLARCHFRCFR